VDAPIGQLIRDADAGDPAAADELFATLYRELHAIASRSSQPFGDLFPRLAHELRLPREHLRDASPTVPEFRINIGVRPRAAAFRRRTVRDNARGRTQERHGDGCPASAHQSRSSTPQRRPHAGAARWCSSSRPGR
jgi:hypothetical protein